MIKVKPLLGSFGKPGEKVSEQDGIYCLEGEGTDIGFNLVIMEEMKRPSLLEFEIRGLENAIAQAQELKTRLEQAMLLSKIQLGAKQSNEKTSED